MYSKLKSKLKEIKKLNIKLRDGNDCVYVPLCS